MRRSLAAATIIAAFFLPAVPASAAPPGRVVVVTVDGTRLSDWRSSSLPGFRDILLDGAVGLLSTRTAANSTSSASARAAAYGTFNTGRFGSAASGTKLVRAAGRTTVIAPPGSPASALALADVMVTLPTAGDASVLSAPIARSHALRLVGDALRTSSLVIVDTGDTARVDERDGNDPRRRPSGMRDALEGVDSFLAGARSDLAPGDTLIVASLTPPLDRRDARRFLSAVAIVGPGIRPGVLTSSSTERDGIVTIADLAPTILERLGVTAPATMTGRTMQVHAGTHAVADLVRLEHALVHASMVRSPLLRGTVYVGSAAIVLALITVLVGASGRAVTVWRAFLETILVAVAAAPLMLMLEPLVGGTGVAGTALTVAAGAVVLPGPFAVLGRRRRINGVMAVTLLVVLGDLVTGGHLAERSPLSYLIVEGARFHGVGNEAMGVVIAAALFAAAAALDRGPTRGRIWAVAAGLALVAIVMAAPQLGDKFGSIPAAVPAFGLIVVLATGRRLDLRTGLAIAVATVLVAGAVIAIDRMGSGTHIARAVSGGSEILGRKAGAAARLLAFSYWMTALLAGAGSLALLAWRRSSLVGRALWGRPATRRALVCCAVAVAGAVAANDAGVIAAAWIALFGGAVLLSAMLSPERP